MVVDLACGMGTGSLRQLLSSLDAKELMLMIPENSGGGGDPD